MTDSNSPVAERLVGDRSRRSFLGKSAVAAVGIGTVTSASGVASAQDDEFTDGPWKALIFQNSFHPEARFAFVSGVLEWNPNYGGIDDSWFSDYNTRTIRWLNTGEHVQLFVADDAEVGEYDEQLGFVPDENDRNRPQVYEVSPEWSFFEDDPRLTTINFGPVIEEDEDRLLTSGDWWQDPDGQIATDDNAGNATAGGN